MGLSPNLLNEDFNILTSWTDADTDTGVSEISPAGQLRLDTNTGAAGNAEATRYKTIASPPNLFTIEMKTYFDLIGTFLNVDRVQFGYQTATWGLIVCFASDGLFVFKTGGGYTEVGTNLVVTGGSAAWQTWRFQVNKSAGEASATVEVFLEGVSKGTVDCDYEVSLSNGRISFSQLGWATNDMVSHYDYIRIATGLGAINDTTQPQIMMF